MNRHSEQKSPTSLVSSRESTSTSKRQIRNRCWLSWTSSMRLLENFANCWVRGLKTAYSALSPVWLLGSWGQLLDNNNNHRRVWNGIGVVGSVGPGRGPLVLLYSVALSPADFNNLLRISHLVFPIFSSPSSSVTSFCFYSTHLFCTLQKQESHNAWVREQWIPFLVLWLISIINARLSFFCFNSFLTWSHLGIQADSKASFFTPKEQGGQTARLAPYSHSFLPLSLHGRAYVITLSLEEIFFFIANKCTAKR